MWSGPTIKVKFSDLCLILSHGPPLYAESRIAAVYICVPVHVCLHTYSETLLMDTPELWTPLNFGLESSILILISHVKS